MTADSAGSQTDGYDGDGLRAWKQGISGKTYFLYEDANPVCELDGSGNVLAVNTWGADGLVSRYTSSGSVFYTFDNWGNVAQRLNSSQSVISSDFYDAFGNRISTGSPDAFGFGARAGYYTDVETGQCLLTFRYYDSSAGRFLTRDPSDYDGGINLYGYVRNDPGNVRDKSGLAPETAANMFQLYSLSAHAKKRPNPGPPQKPPDANCSDAVYAELSAAKYNACDVRGGESTECNEADRGCPDILLKKIKRLRDCAEARQALDAVCFRCGNSGHQAVTKSLWDEIIACTIMYEDDKYGH